MTTRVEQELFSIYITPATHPNPFPINFVSGQHQKSEISQKSQWPLQMTPTCWNEGNKVITMVNDKSPGLHSPGLQILKVYRKLLTLHAHSLLIKQTYFFLG